MMALEITPVAIITACVWLLLGMVTAIMNATNTMPAAIGTIQPVMPELRIVV